MNSNSDSDEASRGNEASSSKSVAPSNPEEQTTSSLCTCEGEDESEKAYTTDIMKRAAAKQLIERYFYQLLDGCGNSNCDNQNCASSGEARNLSPNEAAAEAIKLFYKEARLCDRLPNKVPRTDSPDSPSESSASTTCSVSNPTTEDVEMKEAYPECSTASMKESTSKEEPQTSHNFLTFNHKHYKMDARVRCANLLRKLDELLLSLLDGAPLTEERIYELCDECMQTKLRQPLIRALGEAFTSPPILARSFARKVNEKSNDEGEKSMDSILGPGLDVASCRRAFQYLATVPSDYYSSALVTALKTLADSMEIDLRITKRMSVEEAVNCFVIAFEVPDLGCSDYLEIALPALCHAAEHLPVKALPALCHAAEHLPFKGRKDAYWTLQVLLYGTFEVPDLGCSDYLEIALPALCHAAEHLPVKGRKDVYWTLQVLLYRSFEVPDLGCSDYLEIALPACLQHILETLQQLITLRVISTNYNRQFQVQDDDNVTSATKLMKYILVPIQKISAQIVTGRKFAFLKYPFILTAATKSLGLYYENRIRMYSERRVSLLHAVVGAAPPMPFLRLKVRRTHIIDDALVEVSEQGVDEGGVSKEFFQLIVEAIFNPDYGMFTQQVDSLTTLYKGLKDMLEYTGGDLEEVYFQTFRICYQDVFGNTRGFLMVTDESPLAALFRPEEVEMLVCGSKTQFRRGFPIVTDESPLAALFRPEEVEMLVCGSKSRRISDEAS
ncbi:Ubiquitin-protein ligase E3A [Operophtera brumata]|uniref:HECT-type E3 ubiquitin transferase n=1 Tax=Operophtera brumata TaxID=104452 RepID=A0A0L7LDA1_OPEBR|nr:Ubiquitin-protein ligase E3A [Operophtera brumata]